MKDRVAPKRVCTHPWEYMIPPFRVAGNLYYVGNTSVSSHLIDTGAGLLLIDTGYPQTVYLLLESIRRAGFDPDRIVSILHCHAHYDHCGGTRALVELTGAKTLLGEEDIEMVSARPELSWAPEYGVAFHESFDVDRPLHDGDVVTLGNTTVECVGTPGHTPGAMSYFFEVKEGDRTYTAGIHGGPGLNTLTDEYLGANGLPTARRTDYLGSLDRLKKRRVDVFIGCHPGQSDTLAKASAKTETHNPFVDAKAWPGFLAGLEERARELFGKG